MRIIYIARLKLACSDVNLHKIEKTFPFRARCHLYRVEGEINENIGLFVTLDSTTQVLLF